MDVYPDLKEFIELLNENDVKYLVVGGYAVSYHGRPKYTKDIDIWINSTKENAKKVFKALADFGFGDMDISIKDLTNPDNVIQLGYPPVRIDILSGLEGLSFEEAYKNRQLGSYGNLKKVFYISVDDLIKNKLISGRDSDLADVKWLNKYKTIKRKNKK